LTDPNDPFIGDDLTFDIIAPGVDAADYTVDVTAPDGTQSTSSDSYQQ
jgi:hypothetical protein